MIKEYFIVMVLMIASFNTTVSADENIISTLIELSEEFKNAHESRDYNAISTLINWEGVRKPMRKKIEVYTTSTFGLKIKNIALEEVSDSKFQKHLIGDKELEPNIPVSHVMKVIFDIKGIKDEGTTKDTIVYLLGKNKEQYMISVYVKTGNALNNTHH